ncbi:MAG: Asp-tRNA(Asn)/Glu-tRNA(Gln) amidotransferase subunit GatA [Candidatus Paceibacterota bacterium]|jgi:aspartyl-tRNA(Asn)/glutamyl-tRNA(Gln) amidotransferase subunit A
MKIDLEKLTIKKAHDALLKKEFSARDLTEAYLAEIDKKNSGLNAYLEVFADALEQAGAADEKIKKGEVGVLTGIPLAIKDNILIKGRRAGAASKILEGYVAPYDATVIKKLKEAGAVFLGRVNMDEFAMGGSTENSAYGVTKNPHDETRVSGGSSGGSAASVAANLALAALGSDTGGSVRQPAAFCGVVGLKPTYGAVSRSGLMAMGSSLDQIGPLAKTVEDAEIIFNIIRGQDPMDSTTISEKTYSRLPLLKKFVIGVPRDFLGEGVDKEVLENFEVGLKKLEKAGVEIRDIELPNLKYSLPAYYIIMPAEVSSNLARFDGVKFGAKIAGANLLEDYLKTRGQLFGKEARRRIILGTYVLSAGYYDAYYNKAIAVRKMIADDLKKVFDSGIHAIATPITPTLAFKIGEKINDPLQMYLADIFTVTANITGIPAISIPSGSTGFQLQAPWGREDILFEIGEKFEKI